MAAADYRLCDVCGGKAFYDANLNYRWADTDDLDDWGNKIEEDAFVRNRGYILDHLGDWAVICTECAKTHRVVIESIKGE